jgi:putative ABC transport system ATP-binding protein
VSEASGPASAQDETGAGDTALFRLRELRRSFKPGLVEIEVLKGLNLELQRSEISVILGPSGSGKSTVLNLLGALDRPSSGQVIYSGVDLAQLSEEERDFFVEPRWALSFSSTT